MSSINEHTSPSNADNYATGGEASLKAAWPAVFSISLGVFGLATAEFLPASLLTPIASDFGVSIGAAGQAVTTTAAVAAVAGPAFVLGAGRVDRRTIVWAVTALIVVSDLIAASAPNFGVFLAGRVALGVALAGIGSLAAALCMRLVPPAFFSRAMAMVFTGMTAATVFAPPFGVYVGRVWGWRATFVVAAGVGVLAIAAQVATLPRMAPTSSGERNIFSRLLRRPGIVPALGVGMMIITGHSSGYTYLRPFLERVSKFDASTISLAFLAMGVAGFAGNLSAGVLAERSARLSTSIAAILIAVATATLSAFGQSPAIVFGAIVLWGIGFGITPISVQILTVHAASDLAESAGALTLSAFQVAIAVGAIGGGELADHFGPAGAILSCTLTALIGGGLLLGLIPRQTAVA